MVPSSVWALSLSKTLSSPLADTRAHVSTDSQPTGGGENETLKLQYLLWKMMENFSLVEKNSDNALETVGIIFIKKNKLTHRALQTLETPQPYLPPLYKEPRIQLQPERSPCPLDPSVTLSLKGPARWSYPPGWNVTKINCNLVHGFPSGSAGKKSARNVGDLGSIPGLGRFPREGKRLPAQVFWPGEFHGLYSPWGHQESDMTEQLSL